MSTDTENIEVATIILNQIPRWLRGAVGVRSPLAIEDGLRFDCRGRGPYRVLVTLDRGSDLYNVECWTKSRAPRRFYLAEQVDVEQMVDIVDRIDRGHLHAASAA